MVVVTRALVTHEFEIKISRSDFLNDAKHKADKFAQITTYKAGQRERETTLWGRNHTEDVLQPANYFWYAVPDKLIQASEVPEWAGLVYVGKGPYYGCSRVEKKPIRLHRERLTEKHLLQLCRSQNWRYWNLRIHGSDAVQNSEGEITPKEKP